MNVKETVILPKPPSLVGALTAGFDTAASKISLILFPLALDLLIWFGPHLKLTNLINRFFEQFLALSHSANPQSAEIVRQNQEMWLLISDRLNFLAALRTFPVGIPSLMVSRMPVETPGTFQNSLYEISSFGSAFFIWMLLSAAGMTAAALYFSAVAKAASPNHFKSRNILVDWPRHSLQVILLAVLWLAVIVAVTIPAVFIISIVALISAPFSQIALFIYLGVIIWLIFPLLLSPHGIFYYKSSAFSAMKRSYYITRMTLPYTGLFFLAVFVLSQGLDILWRIPPESSWLSLVGVLGHSFVTTGLLAASFIYYREADQFTIKLQTRWSQLAQLR
jgi:hypothetical protein